MRALPLLIAATLAAPALLAGCIGGADDAGGEPVKRGSTTPATPTRTSPTPDSGGKTQEDEAQKNETLGKRWHFHNYWGLNPNLTLFDGEVHLEAARDPSVSVVPARATVGAAVVRLPYGTVVPPETGTVTVRLHYNASPILGAVNVSYKPANAEEFVPAGRVEAGGEVAIPVTVDMTDVPHRGRSVWAFRLTAATDATGAGVANGTVHAQIVASIGRPIFIDPPHVDHWRGATTVPVVGAEREVHTVKANAAGGFYAAVEPGRGSVGTRDSFVEFPVLNGSVVPEGTKVVLARLAWETPLPPQAVRPALAYAEENSGSSDRPAPVSDKDGERLYRIPVLPRMTDSPYANQSTWTFTVMLDGDASAFSGTVRLDAWASRDGVEAAAFPQGRAETAGGDGR